MSPSKHSTHYEAKLREVDDEVLDDLLYCAEVERSRQTRADLQLALIYAQNAMASEQILPAALLKKLALSIEQTSGLLAESQKYNTTIGYQLHTIGAGVVDASPLQISKTFKAVPLVQIEGTVIIRLQRLLAAWHRNIKRAPKRRAVRPKEENKAVIVSIAIEFFQRHSKKRKPSTDPNNPLSAFVEQFYKYVTETKTDISLEHQIRQVLLGAKSPSGTLQKTDR
jgi:hypothetical protein